MKYRFKFSKGEEIKFIGHLDVVQVFQRAVKRAELPIEYSQGFNPHQLLTFALPLSLGAISEAEYGEIRLKEELSEEDVLKRLNDNMPDGMKILEIKRLRDGVENAMASLAAGSYEVYFNKEITKTVIQDKLSDFMKQPSIVIMKKTKNNMKETDIKPDIFEIEDISYGEQAVLRMTISTGSKRNLKPELVAEAFCRFAGKDFNRYGILYKRTELYKEGENSRLEPLLYGVGV